MASCPTLSRATFLRLCRARDLAASQLDRPLTLDRLAAEACLSPFHFHRLFTAAFGETPGAFSSGVRLAKAKQLLASGHVSVTDTALEVGYASLGSFSSRFRAATGWSPSAYQLEARRVFGGMAPFRAIYIPTCFLGTFAGAG